MTTLTQTLIKFGYYQKIMGIIMIALGIPMLIFGKSVGTSHMLMTGLFVLLTAFDKKQDERSLSLKTSSIFVAFIFAYVLKIVSAELFRFHIIPMELTEINHFIILVLGLTNIFYYFRLYFTD
jgi:hypothetical protein